MSKMSLSATAAIALMGLGLWTPVATAQEVDKAKRGVYVMSGANRSFLGVAVAEVTTERARELKLKEERGVEITRVEEDSPAAKAGLKVNDVVIEYQGQRVEGTEQFVRFVRETPSGREVKLQIVRAGQAQQIPATIASRKVRSVELGDMHIAIPQIPEMSDLPRVGMRWDSGRLGVEAEALNAQLAEFFGVKEGVLVRSVGKGSSAEKAGIKAGDVIVRVDEKKVSNPLDVTRALRGSEKKNVAVVVVREKRESSLNVTIDEPPASSGTPRGRSVRNRDFQF